VDLARRLIQVRQTITDVNGRLIFGTPKT